MRLNRYLAMSGVAARRKADELIAAGRVQVNGEKPPPGGLLVTPGRDVVAVDGRPIAPGVGHSYFAVNKPAGYLSAVSDRSRRPLVTSLLPQGVRSAATGPGLHPVGRLDLRSRGLILLTDDGELSFRLQHPRHHVEKEYRVVVKGSPRQAALERLRRGVQLEEGRTAPAEAEVVGAGPGRGETTLRVVLRQGWKRQLRRSLQIVGHPVHDLARVRIGPLNLGDLAEGRSRELSSDEVLALRAAVDLS